MLAALIMIKNEETSIKTTLNSIKGYIKHVIVLDTGSTDTTVDTIKHICKKNKQVLHLKQSIFKDFASSRNESIEFAEKIASIQSLSFFILLDAGDEFRCNHQAQTLFRILNTIKPTHTFGIVKKHWLTPTGTVEHYDIRFIRSDRNCRYDDRYPVHEIFAGKTTDNMILLNDLIILYQDRILYGASSNGRFLRDIAMLSNAPVTKRNYYHLAQTYMNLDDYDNGFKYSQLALETIDESSLELDSMDDITITLCILNCSVFLKKDFDTILYYFKKVININDNVISAYIYFLKYCIDANLHENTTPYLQKLVDLDKTTGHVGTMVHTHYDYLRWHLICIVCLKTGNNALGLLAAKKACASVHKSALDEIHKQLFDNRTFVRA